MDAHECLKLSASVDHEQKKWDHMLINVIVEKEPFAEGAMRKAYHMKVRRTAYKTVKTGLSVLYKTVKAGLTVLYKTVKAGLTHL